MKFDTLCSFINYTTYANYLRFQFVVRYTIMSQNPGMEPVGMIAYSSLMKHP